MKVLSERLKKAREMKSKELGRRLTQVMVFHETGVHDKTLGGYENGVSEPDAETLKTLANFYGVTVDWLTGNTDNPGAAYLESQFYAPGEILKEHTELYRTSAETIKLVNEQAKKLGLSVSDPMFQKMLSDAFDLLRIARQQNNE